ncbi:MAG: RNA 2',3'-cyclic phosphodiesterase [Gemmatimonadaceae bacterium]
MPARRTTAVRLFLAVNFAPELREALHGATMQLRTAAPEVRWTSAERLHLTLKFLGEQPPETVDRLRPAMDAVAERHHPMDFVAGGVGAFPNFRRARVVWVGVEPSQALELFYNDVEAACERLGFPREGRAFRPHVTLGRVRPNIPQVRPDALAQAAQSVNARAITRVESLDLMASVQDRGGPRYVLRHRSALGDAQ